MTTNRAPKGIPTGGQFVASARSEPSVSLGRPARKLWTASNNQVIDEATGYPVDPESLTADEQAGLDANRKYYSDRAREREAEDRRAAERATVKTQSPDLRLASPADAVTPEYRGWLVKR